MKSQRYGNIFQEEQFQEGRRWLFDPLEEIAKAAETNGIYRSLRVDADLLLPTFQADNVEEFTGFVHKYKSYLSSELDKEHGAMCLQSVYELTVCSRTAFNADGAPLMVSATAEKVSTGGYSDSNKRWSMKNDWSCPEVADMAKLRVKELFGKLKSNEYETVVKLFDELCLYVFSKSTGISMSNLECRVALRRHEIEAATLESPTNDELEEEEEDDDGSLASVVDATENGGRTNGNTSDAEEMSDIELYDDVYAIRGRRCWYRHSS